MRNTKTIKQFSESIFRRDSTKCNRSRNRIFPKYNLTLLQIVMLLCILLKWHRQFSQCLKDYLKFFCIVIHIILYHIGKGSVVAYVGHFFLFIIQNRKESMLIQTVKLAPRHSKVVLS